MSLAAYSTDMYLKKVYCQYDRKWHGCRPPSVYKEDLWWWWI